MSESIIVIIADNVYSVYFDVRFAKVCNVRNQGCPGCEETFDEITLSPCAEITEIINKYTKEQERDVVAVNFIKAEAGFQIQKLLEEKSKNLSFPNYCIKCAVIMGCEK